MLCLPVRLYKAFAADDILLKHSSKLYDLSNPIQSMWFALKYFPIGKTVLHRILYLIRRRDDQARMFNEMKRALRAWGRDCTGHRLHRAGSIGD